MHYDSDGIRHLDEEEQCLNDAFGGDGYSIESAILPSGEFCENARSAEDCAAEIESAEIIRRALALLPLQQAEALKYLYGIGLCNEYTQQEVGEILGLTQSRIAKIKREAEAALMRVLPKVRGGEELYDEMVESCLRKTSDPAKKIQVAEKYAA